MSDADSPTVRDRLAAAGLSDASIAEHLEAGRIWADGKLVVDLDQEAPPPTRVVLRAP